VRISVAVPSTAGSDRLLPDKGNLPLPAPVKRAILSSWRRTLQAVADALDRLLPPQPLNRELEPPPAQGPHHHSPRQSRRRAWWKPSPHPRSPPVAELAGPSRYNHPTHSGTDGSHDSSLEEDEFEP